MRLAALLLICAQAFPQAAVPSHPSGLKYPALSYTPPEAARYRHKLSNGATAFLVEDHDFPLINVQVMVRTGEYLEPEGKTGLASLMGSQMRAGGTTSRAPAQFDEDAAFLAAMISSAMGPLEGSASLNCLSKDVDAGLALFADMLRNPAFDEGRLKLAKNQRLQTLQRRNDSTAQIEAREFMRLMRGTRHFSTREVTKASLEAITRQDLMDFHGRYYYPSNFVLAVSGDFKTSEMIARLEKAFAGWPARSEAVPPVPKPEYTPKPGIYIVDKDVNQGRVRMGLLGDMYTNPDHIAIDVMNRILGGGGFTSRIMSRVRSDEGLAYQAGSTFTHGYFFEGTFSVIFQSRSASVAQAVAIVKEEIERIRNVKVSKEELEAEINYAIESFPRNFATAGARAQRFAFDYYFHMPEDYWQKYRDRVRAVTPDDVQRVARKYLQPDKLVILVVGGASDILKGNPDKPQYSLGGEVVRIPLPDPLTMLYPK